MNRLLVVALAAIFVLGGCARTKPVTENPERSLTYNDTYRQLETQLLYARIMTGNDINNSDKMSYIIRDKRKLVAIVRGFDQLKAAQPEKLQPKIDAKAATIVVTMWREGTSVSYVVHKIKVDYFYSERPNKPLKKIPQHMVELLNLNNLHFD